MDSVGGVFVVLIGGMGFACLMSVLEFIFKGGSLERKSGVKAKSLVAQALTNTNSNIFNIAGVAPSGPPCAHQKPGGRVGPPPLPVPPRPPTIVGGPLPCLGVDSRGPSANSGSLRFLDLGDAGGPRDPYGPMGAPMASQLVSRSLANVAKVPSDSCGPFSKHSYCDLHCQTRHITYSSNSNCFTTALDC